MIQSPIQAIASVPLIDLDYTILVQLVLFVLMSLIATKWLFKPYMKLRADRADGIDGAKRQAQEMLLQAQEKGAAYDAQLAKARERAGEERRALRQEAADYAKSVTDKARGEADADISAAKKKLADQTEAARGELMPQAEELANQMVEKLMAGGTR